jgi:hypothetical protein
MGQSESLYKEDRRSLRDLGHDHRSKKLARRIADLNRVC